MNATHNYKLTIKWTGNNGNGTSTYRSYERSHSIFIEGKPEIAATSDPAFRGDKTKHNPEELLVAALSSCHMLSYLYECANAGVVVTGYTDHAVGTMVETADGGGHFTEVTLNPIVTVKETSMIEKANHLHHEASQRCFIASSVNFPIHHNPTCSAAAGES